MGVNDVLHNCKITSAASYIFVNLDLQHYRKSKFELDMQAIFRYKTIAEVYGMQNKSEQVAFSGREFTSEEISMVRELVDLCSGISRNELAHTVCELLEWKRINGKLKSRECRDFLVFLDSKGKITLPEKKHTDRRQPARKSVPAVPETPPAFPTGKLRDIGPLEVQVVRDKAQRDLFKELLSRYHYLGYAMPFGARLQYLVYANLPHKTVVGCLQFSSPAWRMRARDEWIGWTEDRRKQALQQIVNNSRFLIMASIRNLASSMLSKTLRALKYDWREQYGLEPLLVETLVDRRRFYGGCYRASNWIELGQTTGRGRMDRHHSHKGRVKSVFVYPLVRNAAVRLKNGGGPA